MEGSTFHDDEKSDFANLAIKFREVKDDTSFNPTLEALLSHKNKKGYNFYPNQQLLDSHY